MNHTILSALALVLLSACESTPVPVVAASTPASTAEPAPAPAISAEPVASAAPAASAAPTASAAPAPAPAWTPPQVDLKSLTCDEQECEGLPSFTMSGFPAVSDDGSTFVAALDVDGWGHIDGPALVFVDLATGHSETLRLAERAWTKPTAAQVGARVTKAKERLAKHHWQPARPLAAKGDENTHTLSAGDVLLDFGKGHPWAGSESWDADEITVKRGGKRVATVSLAEHRKHCSTHAIDLLHVDAARGVAVIGDHIVQTGHNCDGQREQPSFTVVKLGK